MNRISLGRTALVSFGRKDVRLIAIVEPKAVRQTSDAAQSCVVRAIDNTTASETLFLVECKNQGKIDEFYVPLSSIKSFLVIEKSEEESG